MVCILVFPDCLNNCWKMQSV
uniref:Uncharacterized protein n=1 Tax=Anguilla anguilla TaxID=7936 RepID=A0A0E9TRA7_ANGAN